VAVDSRKRSLKNITILFSCVGRRVSLVRSFRTAAENLNLRPCIIGTDAEALSAALQLCDKPYVVQRVRHPGYIERMLEIVREHAVDLLVPTIDLDLRLLAENSRLFEQQGCRVLISKPEVVDICQDKRKTFRFLSENGFDTPLTMDVSEVQAGREMVFPCFLKPWDGHAGRGTAKVSDMEELGVFARRIPNCIVQEFVDGTEYTCDVFVDFGMKVRCVVPRKRIEIRGGEVSKGQVVKDRRIMSQAKRLVETLGAGPGVITIQLIVDGAGNIRFIEINPRFGGGVLLSIKAGAGFPKWILQQLLREEPGRTGYQVRRVQGRACNAAL